ncbi:MAG: porin [Alphaproteobacteria bacterium]
MAGPARADVIDDLVKKNEALEQMVLELMQEVQDLKQQVQGAAKEAKEAKEAAAGPAEPAENMVSSGNKNVKLAVSGQVNRGVLYAHDGGDGELFHVDNDNSSTRFRLVGTAQFDEEFSVGTQIEVQLESNSSAAVSQLSDRGADGADFLSQRKLELYLDSETAGRLWLGQGDTASNGTAEVDLSGTTVVGNSDIKDVAGGILFRQTEEGVGETPVSLASPSIGNVFNNLNGLSRDDRLRYDTPGLYGFNLAGSAIADGRYDVALRYSQTIADVKLASAFAFANQTDDSNIVDGSISALHTPTGINLSYAQGSRWDHTNSARNARTFRYTKLGWQWPIFSFGKTALSTDYYSGTDIGENGDFSQAWGLQLVQKIDKIATEIYAGYRDHAYDEDDRNFDDIDVVLTGARIKF